MCINVVVCERFVLQMCFINFINWYGWNVISIFFTQNFIKNLLIKHTRTLLVTFFGGNDIYDHQYSRKYQNDKENVFKNYDFTIHCFFK